MSNNFNRQRRARSVAPNNKKFHQKQKREFSFNLSKERKFNLNENELNNSIDVENELKEEQKELKLNDFVDEISKIKSLLSQLECSTQFWNNERKENNKINLFNQQKTKINLIPSNYGFLLNSDLPVIEEQLNNIKKSLEEFRQFKINQPTKEYFCQNKRIEEQKIKKEKELITPLQIKIELTTNNLLNNIPEIVFGQQKEENENNKLLKNKNKEETNKLILNPQTTKNINQQILESKQLINNLNKLEEQKEINEENSKEVFEPIRQFIFNNFNEEEEINKNNEENQKIKEKELEQPHSSENRKQEEINFEKMLQVLKNPTKFNLSSNDSSSSDDDEIEKTTNLKTKIEKQNLENGQNQSSPKTNQQQQQNIQLNNIPKLQKIGGSSNNLPKPIISGKNESDSDSDFFK
ncbi:hypothetical protein ACQ4LE_004049 [Meloidogyne hapla]